MTYTHAQDSKPPMFVIAIQSLIVKVSFGQTVRSSCASQQFLLYRRSQLGSQALCELACPSYLDDASESGQIHHLCLINIRHTQLLS